MELRCWRVAGLDGSLTSYGLATSDGPGTTPLRYRLAPKLRGHERLEYLRAEARAVCGGCQLAVIERPLVYGNHGDTPMKLAGLHTLICHELWLMGIPYAEVSPAQVKQFATGKGSADKFDMVGAVRGRFPGADGWGRIGGDEADALWLAAMGHQWLGTPIVSLPEAQAMVVHARWDGKTKGHKRGDPKIVWPMLDRRDPVAVEAARREADRAAMAPLRGGLF